MINHRKLCFLTGLSMAVACGGVEGSADEEEGLGEIETGAAAVTNVNHCATGSAPNATSNFPNGSADQYIRPKNRANPGGPCGNNPRSATYVEFTATPGHVIHFIADAEFTGVPAGFCGLNSLIFKVEKKSGGVWSFVNNETTNAIVQGSYCRASEAYGLYPPNATGTYRVRAVAPRWDGLVEEVRIWADDQQD